MLEPLLLLNPDDGPDLAGPLSLRRAWPRSAGHLLLEYLDRDQRIVSGQWTRDDTRLERIAKEAARRCPEAAPPRLVETAAGPVLLQAGGVDRRLTHLHRLLLNPRTTMLSHRPERRAVVRLDEPPGPRFVKVLRPSRLTEIGARATALETLPGRPFEVPRVLRLDPVQGTMELSALPGEALYDRLGQEDLETAVHAVGRMLRWLHGTEQAAVASEHDASAEADLLREQLDRLAAFVPAFASEARARLGAVLQMLSAGGSSAAVLHRDFYDKQIFVQPNGTIGLLDFDTLTVGEAALDIANMIGHLELRALQGLLDESAATAAATAFLAGYEPSVDTLERVAPYLDATRMRLACLYAYRPRRPGLPSELLGRVGRPRGV